MSAKGVISSARAWQVIETDAARQVLTDITHGTAWEHGVHWIWHRGAEFYTEAGLRLLVEAFHAAQHEAAAEALRAELPAGATLEPMGSPRKERGHLPYRDEDDEAIFRAQQSTQAHAHDHSSPVPASRK